MTNTNHASLEDIISTFRRRYVCPQSVATARCKCEQLHFDSSGQKFQDFLEQYQMLAQEAHGDDTPKFIETSFYAKMPPHLKRVLNQARLDTETYDTMVQHLEREMELNGLSDPTDNNVTGIHQIDAHEQQAATNPHKPASPCFGCGYSGHIIKNCRKTASETRNRGKRVLTKRLTVLNLWKEKPHSTRMLLGR